MEDNSNPIKTTRKHVPKGPNQRLRQRTAILIIAILVFGFGAALTRLSFLTLVQGSTLQEAAVEQQLKDTTLPAKRGTIYDANGKVLAESASVWQVVIAPIYLKTDEQREAVAKGLSEILELDYDNVYKKTQQESYYVVVKRKIEVETRDKILELIDTLDEKYECGNVIQLLDDYKRYYPHESLAASVIGFAGSDEQGLEGVEYEYDSYLSGTPGRIVTAKNARGTNMPFQYEQNIEAEDGNNIYLTIDENIQSICEKYMQQGVVDNNVLNKGVCIAMDVNTGAILAMVTTDGYDLNKPYELPADEQSKIDEITDDTKKNKAQSEALSAMWRNKAVSDTYMPGSVFKMCTASMAIEENKVNDNSTFTCTGSITVSDKTMHCANTAGHGTQNFLQALCNSCNPAFVQIGQLVGMNKFREYYQGFGFSEKTGIDLPGEADDTFWAEGEMSDVDLAVASFGQNFSITPIQMITACAAVANGGYVVEPYAIERIEDSRGRVVYRASGTKSSHQLSTNTAAEMTAMMKTVITSGTGRGANIGKPAAGKTGTTDDYRDAYFVGYTPDIVTGVWVGDDNNRQMPGLTGGTVPARIWHDIMIVATEKYGSHDFDYPEIKLNGYGKPIDQADVNAESETSKTEDEEKLLKEANEVKEKAAENYKGTTDNAFNQITPTEINKNFNNKTAPVPKAAPVPVSGAQ